MLKEILTAPERRSRVVDDGVRLVDDEVASKSGLSGLAVKAAYGVVKALKPGIIRDAVDGLLDDFVTRLEPFYSEFKAQGNGRLESFFSARAERIANALLGVTDERAARSSNATLKKAYEKLRPTGVKHTASAVPGLARLVQKHV